MILRRRPSLFCALICCCLYAATCADRPIETCYPEEFWRAQDWTNYTGVFERCGPDLVCRRDHAVCEKYCNDDEDCEGYPLRICDGKTFKCRHDGIFKGGAGADVGAAILFLFISGLALSAGIGGGGLYVPLLMAILGFTLREATGLSQACLSGGSSTALIYNLRQRHPSGKKPMIDYTLVLVMGPNLLIGALIGSTLNASAPSWLILNILMVVLCHSVWKTFRKAIKTLRKEQAGEVRGMPAAGDARLSKNLLDRCLRLAAGSNHRQLHDCEPGVVIGQPTAGPPAAGPPAAAASAGTEATEETVETGTAYVVGKPVATESEPGEAGEKAAEGQAVAQNGGGGPSRAEPSDPEGGPSGAEGGPSPEGEAQPAARPGLIDLDLTADHLDQQESGGTGEQRQYPRRKLLGFVTMWSVTVACILARGGKGAPGLVPYCSAWSWLIALATIAGLACISLQAARRAVAEAADRPERAPDVEGELQWTARTARSVAKWSLLAGTLAALCGIGGGMVMGPILLDLGFLPQVQSATTAATLFVMSTSTCLAFLVAGAVPADYVLWLAAATGTGAIFGKAAVGYVVKRLRRPSIIMFLLGGIIAASIVVMGITGVVDIVNDIRNGQDMLFKSFCGGGEEE